MTHGRLCSLGLAILMGGLLAATTVQTQAERVVIKVDASKRIGPMKPVWAWFGYDEPNYTYMKDGQKLLTELSKLSPVPVFVRTHNLLTSGDGTPGLKWGSTNAYTEDASGKPIYDWTIVDRIVDTYLKRGMKPMMQIGFMPEAMSVKPSRTVMTGSLGFRITASTLVGRIRRRTTRSGASSSFNGRRIR